MADFESVAGNAVAVFTELPLDLLEEEWIEIAWDGKYTNVTPPNLSFELDDGNVASLINQICNACDACKQWHRVPSPQENDGQDDELWKTLMDSGVHHKTLLGLLYGGIVLGSTATASLNQKNIALSFVKLYFNLILVPGSRAYGIFQESLFERAVQCLRLPDRNVTSLLTSDTSHKGSQPSRSGRQNAGKKRASQNDDSSLSATSGSSHHENEEISKEALYDHLTCMTDCLRDFALLLQSFSMLPHGELAEAVIQQVCELTQIDIPGSHLTFSSMSQLRHCHYKYHTLYAYATLKQLCLPLHGCPADNFLTIAKHLMPNILMVSGTGTTVSRTVSNIRDHTISFFLHIVEHHNEGDMEDVIKILITNLAFEAVDKSDFRLKTAQAVMTLMKALSDERFSALVSWFEKLLHSSHNNLRIFALEMTALLIWEDRVGDGRASLLLTAMGRCNDKASTVKTKALGVLTSVTSEPPSRWVPLICQSAATAQENEGPTVRADHLSQVMQMLALRVEDDKVHVRRTALGVLENVLCASTDFLKEKYMKIMQDRCRDPAVLVRKQALQCLTRCLQVHSSCDAFLPFWLEGALPAVLDGETSVQEKAVDMVESVLIAPLFETSGPGGHDLTWRLLCHLTQQDFSEYHKYLQKAVGILARNGKLRTGVLKRLKPHIGGVNNAPAWLLASKYALFTDLGEAEFAIEYWNHACVGDKVASTDTLHHVLLVIHKTAHHLPQSRLKDVIGEFEQSLEDMTLSVEVLPQVVDCLCALSHLLCKGNDEKWFRAIGNWGKRTLERCQAYLSPVLLKCSVKVEDSEDQIVRHLVLLGEAAQRAPKAVTEQMQELVESCVSAPYDSEMGATAKMNKKSCRRKTPTKHPEPDPKGLTVTPQIRAHAFITVGKMCLQNEVFAKQSVAALAKELDKSKDVTIRNNIIVILADLCKRYAVLVDPYLPYVIACLKDPNPDLRRLTLERLFVLLQQDFIKLRGSLFYSLFTMLVDKRRSICELAKYGLGIQVYARHPHVFYQRFTETMYHFNNVPRNLEQHDVALEKSVTDSLLAGRNEAEHRMIIYRFLLDHMSDEERFKLNLSITQNVLAPCMQEGNSLIKSCPDVLKDALAVLCCEEIKLRSITAADDATEEDPGRAVLNAARKNILSTFVKKNLIENVIPVVIELKRHLEAERSPLVHNLLLFLRELMRDYKNEVKDILALDKNTASEVAFDLKKLDEKETAEREKVHKKVPAEIPGTPTTSRTRQAVLQTLESARRLRDSALRQKSHADKGQPDDCLEECTVGTEVHEQLKQAVSGVQPPTDMPVEEATLHEAMKIDKVGTGVERHLTQHDDRLNGSEPHLNAEQQPTPGDKYSKSEQVGMAGQQSSAGNSAVEAHTSHAFKSPLIKGKRACRKSPVTSKKENEQLAAQTTPTRPVTLRKSPRGKLLVDGNDTLTSIENAETKTQSTPEKDDAFKVPQMKRQLVKGKKQRDVETSTPVRRGTRIAPFPSDVSLIK
ncbi:condensin-2 complex subunit D3-like isoform X2 [Ornithodoros turicata]|uniref:condensin-2 complex subunit D3-like isoform X2 n=1 Tax=Ornithodoros turicata TaxID=34597 RepID=UPI00313A3959